MGKDNRTAEAFEIAKDFVAKGLSSFLQTHDAGNMENIFPLSHVPPNRSAIRAKLWESIEENTTPRSGTALNCRAALLFFSEWIFKEAIVTRKHVAYEDPDAKYLPLSRRPVSDAIVDEHTPKLSRVKVKKIKAEKDWFETKLELLKLIYPMITNYMDRATIKRQIQETAYYLKAYESAGTPSAAGKQDLIFNALVFTILSILHISRAYDREEAEATAAALINEYCYWNPRISSLVRKLTRKKVADLYDNSPLRKRASLQKKKALHSH